MMHEPRTADQTITEIVGRLSTRFPSYPTPIIREIVGEAYEQLNDAHVRDFVEVLVEKQAKKQLKILDLDTAAAIEWQRSLVVGANEDRTARTIAAN